MPSRSYKIAGLWGVVAALGLCLSAVASGTTFVLMNVDDLAAASDIAVLARVESIQVVEWADGSISTEVEVRVERVAFGDVSAGDTLLVSRPGGTVRGRREWVSGSSSFALGEDVFVFLRESSDGRVHVTGMSMGKYRVVDGPRERLASRSFGSGVSVIDPASAARPQSVGDGDGELRLSELMNRARRASRRRGRRGRQQPGELRGERVRRDPGTPEQLETVAEYTFLEPQARWFEADDGTPIRYFVDSAGDETLGLAASLAAAQDGFAAWTSVPSASIILESAGPAEPAPFSGCPDDNRIVFNDPFGELQNPSDCRGILALGGFCDAPEEREVNGEVFRRIVTGKLTLNNGWGECPFWTVCGLAEIVTHEIGHTIGLGHSEFPDATMATDAHFDGRCGTLRSDDETGVTFMYPALTPTATPTATPSSTPTVTDTPTITLTPSRTHTSTRTPRPPTRTRTFTRTRTSSRTATTTRTRPSTRTPTGSRPPTETATATATATDTATATSTATPSPNPIGEPFLELLLRALRRLLESFLALFS